MAKNLIPEVCKLLGVDVGEAFHINNESKLYKINEDGMIYYLEGVHYNWEQSDVEDIVNFLNGECEIFKLPWKPQIGEAYWTFGFTSDMVDNEVLITWNVCDNQWYNTSDDFALFGKGWVYRTREEAAAALPKVAKELGVEYEL